MAEGGKPDKELTPKEAQKRLEDINLPSQEEIILKGGELYEISRRIKEGMIKEDDSLFLTEAFHLFNNLGLKRLLIQIATGSPNSGTSPTGIEEIIEQANIDFEKGPKSPDALKKYVGTLMYAEPGYGCKIAVDSMIIISEKLVKS